MMKKISTKIWVGFIILLVLTSVVIGFTYYKFNSLHKEIVSLAEKRVPLVNASQDLSLNFARQAAGIRGYLATGNEMFLTEFNDAKKIADEKIAYLNENVMDRQAFEQVKQAAKEYEPHPLSIIAIYRQQGQQAATSYMASTAAPANAKVINEINKFVGNQRKIIEEDTFKIQSLEENITKMILTMLLLGLLLGSIIAFRFMKLITKNLENIAAASVRYAQGDFREEMNVTSSDELGQMANALNTMRSSFIELITSLQKSSGDLNESSKQLSVQAQHTSAGASETAATVGEISSSIEQVSQNAQELAETSGEVSKQAMHGSEGMERLADQMGTIAVSSNQASEVVESLSGTLNQVGQIVDIITSIADQTNLLALNAAIEAARAGEQGRSFAVVAEEVRKLAEQSASAAKDIGQLIHKIEDESKEAVDAMSESSKNVLEGVGIIEDVGDRFKGIIESVENLVGQIQSVAAATEQVSAGTQEVAATTEEQTAAMEEISAATEHLNQMASEINQLTNKFKL